jgi:signal transduction histidine kinase
MIPHKKVFLVDDSPFFVKLCEKGLIKNGFSNIHVFNSGEELLSNLISKPDIIFLDYHLNDYTGKELLHKIKAFNPDIAVVMMSSQDSMDITIDLLNNGAFDYLIKNDVFIEKLLDVSYKLVSFFSSQQNAQASAINNFSGREYANIVLDAQKKVQKEISFELHDNIIQLLSSSKLYLEIAAINSSKRVDLIKDSVTILETAIADVRALSHDLSSVILLKADLNEKLPALIKQLKANENFVVRDDVAIENFDNYLNPYMQHEVLRILQELTNNIIKHSQAQNISIKITAFKTGLNMKVSDDGKGFDQKNVEKSGIGLNNIFTRITNLSGKYELDTAKNKGCTWNILIPAFGNLQQTYR